MNKIKKTIIEQFPQETEMNVDDLKESLKNEIKDDIRQNLMEATENADDKEDIDESLLSELSSGKRVVVYRFNKDSKKFVRLDEWDAKEFSLGLLGDTYGGGVYKIYVFKDNGQIMKHKVVEIDNAKKPKYTDSPNQPNGQIQAISPQFPDITKPFERLHEAITTQNDKFLQVFMATLESNMKMMMMMMNNNKQSDGKGLINSLDDLIKIKNFLSNSDPLKSTERNIEAIINALKKGIEIGELSSGLGEQDLLSSVFKAVVDSGTIGKLSNGLFNSLKPQLPSNPQVSQPLSVQKTDSQKTSNQGQPSQKISEGTMFIVDFYKKQLIRMFDSGVPAKTIAEYVVGKIPDPYLFISMDIISGDEWKDYLIGFDREFYTKYEAKINEVIAEIRSIFSEYKKSLEGSDENNTSNS